MEGFDPTHIFVVTWNKASINNTCVSYITSIICNMCDVHKCTHIHMHSVTHFRLSWSLRRTISRHMLYCYTPVSAGCLVVCNHHWLVSIKVC